MRPVPFPYRLCLVGLIAVATAHHAGCRKCSDDERPVPVGAPASSSPATPGDVAKFPLPPGRSADPQALRARATPAECASFCQSLADTEARLLLDVSPERLRETLEREIQVTRAQEEGHCRVRCEREFTRAVVACYALSGGDLHDARRCLADTGAGLDEPHPASAPAAPDRP